MLWYMTLVLISVMHHLILLLERKDHYIVQSTLVIPLPFSVTVDADSLTSSVKIQKGVWTADLFVYIPTALLGQ